MRLSNVHRIAPKCINDLEVMLKHIRVLIIFGVDILPYRRSKRELGRLAKGDGKDVSEREMLADKSRDVRYSWVFLRRHGFVCEPDLRVLEPL